jgi:hypothetical protein
VHKIQAQYGVDVKSVPKAKSEGTDQVSIKFKVGIPY